jgi:class 3 adenylate cyclase
MSEERSAERRLVTCVFIDCVGSTQLTSRVGPERTRRLLDEAFAAISARAAAEGGTVEKYIGDEVFVLFGAPVAHRDDAVRALRLADGCTRWLRESGTSLSMRVGIETGEALVDLASVEARQRMAVGSCVNIAARLQQHAQPGDVVVGPTCRAAATASAEFDDLGELDLKGLGRVRASRLRRLVETAAPRATFVGRDEELSRLESAFERTIAGDATFVVVTGEPGIGKSRLLDEFVRRVPRPASVLRAACRPGTEAGAAIPLRQLAGDDASILPAGVAHAVGLTRDARLLALATADRQTEIEGAWREHLTRLAGESPVVVAVEDAHWAEAETVRVLDRATFRNPVPLMVVVTARPEFPALTAIRPGGDRLFLELAPLRDADAEALARAEGARDVEQIARAAGNPLFILELARARTELGRDLPLTLQAVIAARLDELAESERDLLQRASVVGERFTVRDAALLSDRAPAEIAGVLGRLSHLRYLEPVADAFRFHHALIRDAAYARLTSNARMRMHARYASEGIDPLDVEALAHHWWEAVGPSDAEWVFDDRERESMRREALRAHLAAGQRLADRLAAQRMVVVFDRALALARGPAEAAEVEEALGLAYHRNARGEDATNHRLRAIELRRSAGAVTAKLYADALDLPTLNWGYFKTPPKDDDVRRLIEEGIAQARASADALALVRLLVQRGIFDSDPGVVREIDETLATAEDPRPYADALWRLAFMHAVVLHDVASAMSAIDRALSLGAQGASFNEPEALTWGTTIAFHAGLLTRADELAARLSEIAKRKSVHTRSHALGASALVRLGRGEWDALEALGREFRELVDANPEATFCVWGMNLAAWGALAGQVQQHGLPPDLSSFAERLIPEAPSTRAATLLPVFAMSGTGADDAAAARSYDAATRISDRYDVIDFGGMNMVLANVVRERWHEAERWLANQDRLAANGARFCGAFAAAVREEIAHARGGPAARHAALRELGYPGFSELLSYRAAALPARS